MLMDLMIAEFSVPTQWIVLSVALLGVGIVLFKPKFLRARRDPLARSPQDSSLAQHRSVEREMQNLLVELSEMSRQVTASLDTRAAKLDLLIREADEKIATLSATLAVARNGVNVSQMNHGFTGEMKDDTSDITPGEIAGAIAGEIPVGRREIFVDQTPAMTSAAFNTQRAVSEFASAHSPAHSPSPYDIDPRHAEVYQMADQGMTASAIAAQLQRPNGEIQLILALRAR